MTVHGRDKLGGAEHDVCPDHIEIASFMALAAATGGELRIRDTVPGGPGGDPPPLPPPRPAVDGRGATTSWCRPTSSSTVRDDHGRRDPQDRRRPLAGLPRGPHLDRAGARHAGRRDDPDLREDVREPAVLRRQARRDGRSDHALRSPQGDRQRSEPSSRRSPGEPRHPRRHGDAHRGAGRARAPRRSATWPRSTAATSASTCACASWAPASSGSPSERVPA